MKTTMKKVVAVGLTVATVTSLSACGNSSGGTAVSKSGTNEITKPKNFTVMADGTMVRESNGAQAFYDYYSQLTGLDITWIRPDHSGYYDAVSNAFNSDDTTPDVILLSSDYDSMFASSGLLWDMSEAWNNSETKNSGRLISGAEKILDAYNVPGPDGTIGMYGFPGRRGNGCCTYIKASWLKAIGKTVADVEDKTLTFNEYYQMLTDMKNATGKSVIAAPGFISAEVPYTNYLPEFYQNAQYSFYKNSSGQYVDGFTEQAMKDALARIAKGVKDGIIDKESVNGTTSTSVDKFLADSSGVFTYWAGTWAYSFKTKLEARGLDSEVVAIKPIQELGAYVERISPCWAITAKAENPEGIFKYFIDTMLDGADVQTAWEYGAKGTHWDTIAETVTVQGKESSGTAFKEGEFHMLPSPETPTSLMVKNYIDPLIALATFKDGNPGASTIQDITVKNQELFNDNSQVASPIRITEEYSDNISDISKQRSLEIADVAMGNKTVDEAMADYNSKVGSLVQIVLKSLNK